MILENVSSSFTIRCIVMNLGMYTYTLQYFVYKVVDVSTATSPVGLWTSVLKSLASIGGVHMWMSGCHGFTM